MSVCLCVFKCEKVLRPALAHNSLAKTKCVPVAAATKSPTWLEMAGVSVCSCPPQALRTLRSFACTLRHLLVPSTCKVQEPSVLVYHVATCASFFDSRHWAASTLALSTMLLPLPPKSKAGGTAWMVALPACGVLCHSFSVFVWLVLVAAFMFLELNFAGWQN